MLQAVDKEVLNQVNAWLAKGRRVVLAGDGCADLGLIAPPRWFAAHLQFRRQRGWIFIGRLCGR